jgi:hypothetical protein
VSETTVNEVAAFEPNVTAVVFVKPEPLMTAVFPPATGPRVGLTLLTTGATAFVPKVTPVVERRFVLPIVPMFLPDTGWLVREREVITGAATAT